MKKFITLLFLTAAHLVSASNTPADIRNKIGSVFTSPTLVGDKYYFVATTGALYEASMDFKDIKKIFEGKRQTLSSIVHHQGKLIWGEGVHKDRKFQLYVYDLNSKKMDKILELDGHMERSVFIDENQVIVPSGAGGITAIDLTSYKILWNTKTYQNKPLHIDSNIVKVGDMICGTTLYETKGVVCLSPKTGIVSQLSLLNRSPKSEITVWNNHVVGFATEGDLTNMKFDVPSDFYVYNVSENKFKHLKELRGFNFFSPVINGNTAFITLSTGDFIFFQLDTGRIDFLGEFSEPFINNPFMKGKSYCGISIMGKFQCYMKTKAGFALETDRRILEHVIGKISYDKKLIVPTRIGHHVE